MRKIKRNWKNLNKLSKVDGFAALSTKSTPYLSDGCSIKNDSIANSNEEGKLCMDKKLSKSGKISAQAKRTTGIEIHKMVTSKPWFSTLFSVDNSIPNFVSPPVSVTAASDALYSSSVLSIPHTNINDLYSDTKAKQPLLESTFTNILKESRSMCPRILVDKTSK